MKGLYEMMYRYSFVPIPYDIGPREELVRLVEGGRLQPCRAIDLGSGTASNAIYLAQHGFDATGVDFSPPAIELGRTRAREAGVEVTFISDHPRLVPTLPTSSSCSSLESIVHLLLKAPATWSEAAMWTLLGVVCCYPQVFSSARVAMWRAFEVPWRPACRQLTQEEWWAELTVYEATP